MEFAVPPLQLEKESNFPIKLERYDTMEGFYLCVRNNTGSLLMRIYLGTFSKIFANEIKFSDATIFVNVIKTKDNQTVEITKETFSAIYQQAKELLHKFVESIIY